MRLVIADDDRDAAETLAELLRLLIDPPVAIVLAFDGQEALAAATGACKPDAVIMDIQMPRMDGVKAAIGIRSALGSEAPTLIAITGYVDITKRQGVRGVFDHVLTKPANVDEIVRLLASL